MVIALLGALTLLGLLFFTFATQEQQNAANFSDASKRPDNLGDNIDVIFDESIRQLAVGGSASQRNSALWMGRHSLVFNMFGQDLQPYSGTGVNLIFVPGTGTIVDQDRDGIADTALANYDLLDINDSPAARNFLRNVFAMPAADVDYTYPDHNNAFLAYDAYTWDFSTTPPTKMRVVKPSFHRPELLRDSISTQANWFTVAATSGRVFRPHPFHVYCPSSAGLNPAPVALPGMVSTVMPGQYRFLLPVDIDRNGNGVVDPGDVDFNGNGMIDADVDRDGNGLIDPGDVDINGNGQVNQNDQGLINSLPGGSGEFPFVVDLPAPVTGATPGNPNLVANEQYLWSLNTSATTLGPYEYDVDNDDDGVMDSIWMDLDLPVRTRKSDNAKYLPLVAFKVVDLDSLINLNAAGNLSGDTQTNATTNFGNGADISRSSAGLSPAEINPIWALDTAPTEAKSVRDHGEATSLRDHNNYFGHYPANQRELANMELWWLLKGRIEYSVPPQIHAGRFGDADRVGNVNAAAFSATPPVPIAVNNSTQSDLFPFPGVWNADDNLDINEGLQKAWLAGSTVTQTQAFVHPLPLNSRGSFWLAGNPKQLDLVPNLAGAGNPCTWLRYTGIGLGYDSGTATANTTWLNPFGGALVPAPYLAGANGFNPTASAGGQWVDDPLEVTLEPRYISRPTDDPFEPQDSLFLHMSKVDRDRTEISSRIASLMPVNIDPGTTSDPNQVNVAKRFTTESWDPKTFGLPRFQGGVGLDGQPGKAGIDDNLDGTVDDRNELGWPGSDDDRAWEYNVDTDSDGKLEFPPQFNPIPFGVDGQPGSAGIDDDGNGSIDDAIELGWPGSDDYQPSLPENAYGAKDPFRPQLRRLLSTEFANTSNTRQPMRLSVNEFLDVDRRAAVAGSGNPYTSQLLYRPLTEHAQDNNLTTLPATFPAYTPTTWTSGERELWARKDRQQMARDIYVLLYTFCGGNDSATTNGNVTTTPGATVYPRGIVPRQMAHFAVNLVDALDPDNVITAFEYDRDLSNGWDLDDDFTTTADGGVERDVVYGVEAQELTFSEVLWAWQDVQGADHPLTPFDETVGENNFLQVELRCVSPSALDLFKTQSTTTITGVWRIHRDDINNRDANRNSIVELTENAVTFVNGTYIAGGPTAPPNPAFPLQPGALFTIASADLSPAVGSATLYIDTAATAGFEAVAPNKPGAFTSPLTTTLVFADLDLNHTSHSSFVKQANGATPSDFLSRNNNPGTSVAGTTTIRSLNLDRRLNPNLVRLPLAQNPFHTVDEFRDVPRQPLGITPAITTPVLATAQLATLSSSERSQPLHGNGVASSSSSGPSALPNTLAGLNSNSPAAFNLFESHFDRDFASVIELFQIPLRGPTIHTREVVNARRPSSLEPTTLPGLDLGQLGSGGPSTFGGAVLMETEDIDHDGVLTLSDDTNGNGIQDGGETDSNGIPGFDFGEDVNNNGVLDSHPYHFHRLLSLVEVPTRTHRQLGNPLEVKRVPGKINLNGIRDPQVLAAVIDDRSIISPPERDLNNNNVLDANEDLNPTPNGQWDYGLRDATGTDASRDWWYQFLIARDGQIPLNPMLPFNAMSNPMIPPLPMGGVSQPFRDLGVLSVAQQLNTATTPNQVDLKSPIENTIFRGLFPQSGPISPLGNNGRRLFELATDAQLAANPSNTTASVDPLSRHRVLSKIMGNTTNRSNVFVVFVTIGMFECLELPSGAVRIGGQMDVDGDGQKDTHRAVFIIDRSQAEEAFDPTTGTFDWKKLVKARQRIN